MVGERVAGPELACVGAVYRRRSVWIFIFQLLESIFDILN